MSTDGLVPPGAVVMGCVLARLVRSSAPITGGAVPCPSPEPFPLPEEPPGPVDCGAVPGSPVPPDPFEPPPELSEPCDPSLEPFDPSEPLEPCEPPDPSEPPDPEWPPVEPEPPVVDPEPVSPPCHTPPGWVVGAFVPPGWMRGDWVRSMVIGSMAGSSKASPSAKALFACWMSSLSLRKWLRAASSASAGGLPVVPPPAPSPLLSVAAGKLACASFTTLAYQDMAAPLDAMASPSAPAVAYSARSADCTSTAAGPRHTWESSLAVLLSAAWMPASDGPLPPIVPPTRSAASRNVWPALPTSSGFAASSFCLICSRVRLPGSSPYRVS